MPPVHASLPARDHDAPDPRGTDARDRGAPNPGGINARDHGTPDPGGTDNRGPETLDRYARAGGMAPDRIRRILADLVPSLAVLHRAGRAHGDIAPATIGLDESGRARLLTAPLVPDANAEDASRHDGYAAFEQYTDDADTPCGPWTDIYALSATACALLTGLAPPSALARCVRDDYVPLTRRRGQDEQAFCAVLDGGLAMDAYARPQTIDEFARALRLDMMPAAAVPRPPQTGPGERLSTLEDADGLEATSAWATAHGNGQSAPQGNARPMPHHNVQPAPRPAAGQSSQVAVYREEQKSAAPTTAPETARDPAAVEYEAAVASIHARGDRKGPLPERTQAPPITHPPKRHRAPLLMILAVVVIIAAALYVWARPRTPSGSTVVASASDTASGNARGNAGGNDANGASAGASNGSRNGASNTAAGAAPGGASSNSTASTTPMMTGGSPSASSTAGIASPGATSAPSGTQGANPQSSSSQATAAADSGTSNALPATAGAPNAGSATAAAGSPAAGASPNGTSTTGTSSTGTPSMGNAAVATALPAGSSDAKQSTPADTKPRAIKAPVAVAIAVRPWGEILVNGKSRGVSPPLHSVTLAPGTYDITIRNNAGPDVHQSLTITAGKTATISHTFN